MRIKFYSCCAAGRNRTTDALLFQGFGLYHLPIVIGSRALMQDYCWDSLASLYTCFDTSASRRSPSKIGSGLSHKKRFSPNSPGFHLRIASERPEDFQASALPLSYRGIFNYQKLLIMLTKRFHSVNPTHNPME